MPFLCRGALAPLGVHGTRILHTKKPVTDPELVGIGQQKTGTGTDQYNGLTKRREKKNLQYYFQSRSVYDERN